MPDSLLLGGIQLLGFDRDPEFRLTPEFDFGSAEPELVETISQFLDGNPIRGDRSGNREVTLKVVVLGRTPTELAYLEARLEGIANQAQFTLTLHPDGGLPVIWDCYRARVVRQWSFLHTKQSKAYVTLTFKASPFARSNAVETITVVSAQTAIDSFESYTGTRTFAISPSTIATALITSPRTDGSRALRLGWVVTGSDRSSVVTNLAAATIDIGLGTTLNLSAAAAVQLFTRSQAENFDYNPSASFDYTLTLYSDSKTRETTYRADPTAQSTSAFTKVAFSLTAGTTVAGKQAARLEAITHYRLVADPGPHLFRSAQSNARFYLILDDLRAMPPGSVVSSTSEGGIYSVDGVKGTARAPASIEASQSSGKKWNGLVVHRAPTSDPAVLPIVQLARPLAKAQTVVLARTRRFYGTYDMLLVSSIGGGTYTRTYEVVTTQTMPGGTTTNPNDETNVTRATNTLSFTFSPSTLPQGLNGGDGANGAFVPMGQITLPLIDHPVDNTSMYYSFEIKHPNATDFFFAILLLDKAGQTIRLWPTANFERFWIDEPTPGTALHRLYGGLSRANAVGLLGEADVDGGLMLEPGSNQLTVYSPQGAPSISASYTPRWRTERVS